MKKLISLLVLALFPLSLMAQQQGAEYNRKGDEAMKRLDYSDAKIWYEEGVSLCDPYSISQLTRIWMEHERIRPSMRSLMTKSLNCLNVMGTENDTTAIANLVQFYAHGIGVPKSQELASYWEDRLKALQTRITDNQPGDTSGRETAPREPMRFFVGYAFSTESPFGITFGGVSHRWGWYGRLKTNFSFTGHSAECNDSQLIGSVANGYYHFTNRKKVNSMVATGGVLLKCTPWLYSSVGIGYGDRSVLYEYQLNDETTGTNGQSNWARNVNASYRGIALEADVMAKVGRFFVSAGCHTVHFKYIDLNAGVGLFF